MPDARPARERDRYARASLRELLGGELTTLRAHPGVIALLVFMVGGWLFLTLTRPAVVQVADLRTGDCLYIHAADADTDTPGGRATGTTTAALSSLYEHGTERARCDGSLSHEVMRTFVVPGDAGAPFPGTAAVEGPWLGPCAEAFTSWVGRPEEGSALELVVAVPDEHAWNRGVRAGACLVGSRDGQFLPRSVKGSGR